MPVKQPKLIIFNEKLANALGMDLPFDDTEMLGNFFSGNRLPVDLIPIAQAYAGHQFGHFSILGDGRAHLIGEQIMPNGSVLIFSLKVQDKLLIQEVVMDVLLFLQC